jgi:hypothetical protein
VDKDCIVATWTVLHKPFIGPEPAPLWRNTDLSPAGPNASGSATKPTFSPSTASALDPGFLPISGPIPTARRFQINTPQPNTLTTLLRE